MYQIIRCRNCPNAVIDLDQITAACTEIFRSTDFTNKQLERLGSTKPKQHHIFQVGIAGCPNSCSQPQIKDFGLQGQAVPVVGDGCTACGLCVSACPDQAIVLGEEGPCIVESQCLNCGKCAKICPTGAIYTGTTGYRVIRGGKLGRRPQLAREVYSLTNQEGAVQCLRETLDLLLWVGKPGERLGALLERIEKGSS
ncbi:4Fe-4S ferredoxin, iron-sulfur binding domain protein [Desulforamulus reducens MI-1]|uniref:4Fe-4S ferredoxin, iron-sulfur binding domain protein n=2 Tax=Desulforamulus TaxID=2916693 RepID=A4J2D3_DESRM|nr:4Fe-4S ferredoxin, iron-sulfur binding domain protein [Desulforamulus reducens MI-1]